MAMTVPALGILPSIPTYNAPLTPRVKASKLDFEPAMTGIAGTLLGGRSGQNGTSDGEINGSQELRTMKVVSRNGHSDETGVRNSFDGTSDNEGRRTPVPDVDATLRRGKMRISQSSGPPRQPAAPSSILAKSSAPAITNPMMNQLPPAHMGLGTLHGEEQLKISLQSKDRIFVVMLSKEIEAFIQRCLAGETPDEAQAVCPNIGGAPLLIFGNSPTVKIQSQSTSKFQRMLVYKAAEWYGVKAVSGPENAIYVGTVGVLPEKSASLKLAALVPERETPQQKFQIMQRSQPVGSARSGLGDGGDGGPTSRKTLEQREAEYAAARERIYGPAHEEGSVIHEENEVPTRTRRVEDDIDPVSRYAYGADALAMASYEPVFASLYHPPHPDGQRPDQIQQPAGGYYVNTAVPYPTYQVMGPGYTTMTNGYSNVSQNGQQPMYAHQAFDQNGNPIMLVPQQMNGYPQSWQPQQPGTQNMIPPSSMQPMMNQGQMANNGWLYTGHPQQQTGSQQMMMNPNMNGSSSPPSQAANSQYNYSTYGGLEHPQPLRPQPQQHSSASSSISSHSYQSYSRPHSRGSATSTRSAASSARFANVYPAQTQYRQKGMKGGVNGLTSLGIAQERRAARGQSPSSTTTTSSRSSRRANSIAVPTPSLHPLPQRPDWAANNIPYEPSAAPLPGQIHSNSNMHGQYTIPAPANGLHNMSPGAWSSPQTSNGNSLSGTPSYTSSSPATSLKSHTPNIPPTIGPSVHRHDGAESDHRRNTISRSSQTLFDPTSSSSASIDLHPTNGGGISTTSSQDGNVKSQAGLGYGAEGSTMSPEDIIEAKLQALSFSTGVAIGPPPARGSVMGPSYAKVVRK